LERVFGPRPILLIGFGMLVLALLGAFAYVVVNSQSQSRRQAQQRFNAEATIAAQLISSLLTASAPSSEAAASKAFGGRVIDRRALDAAVTKSGLAYLLILNQHGAVIGASTGAPRTLGTRSPAARADIASALGGQAELSDILAGPKRGTTVLESALPFQSSFGRRVEVEATDPSLIFAFLGTYLSRSLSEAGGTAFVLDSRGRMVGASTATAKPGDSPKATGLTSALAVRSHGTYRYSGTERYFASAPVQESTWQVVLAIKTSGLYPALAGSESWLLYVELAAFALAGAASLLFFRRALQNGAELALANSALTAVNSGLEQRVADRTAAAEQRATELARSNEELEQFSSVASHDLQEPLRKIRMFGDRLRMRLGDGLAEEPADDLARMENAAERMQRLISDLLDYSRVTHRGKEFEQVPLDVVAKEVIVDLEARVVELNAQVEVGDLPVIEADWTQMRQLFQNLIANALKFHREGEQPVVRISSEVIGARAPRFPGEPAAGGRCVITFEDNGIGFDARHSERVFTAFQRLHGRSSYEGTGIGLSIARKIVWRHGGQITATGVPDGGATFVVTLPLSQSSETVSQSNGGAGGDAE
jgi:signal transduction histidine kinase